MDSRCAVSAIRIFAARIAGDTPATWAPAGTIAERRERIARPNERTPAAAASAADPTGGAPSDVCRNVTIKSCAANAGRDPRVRRVLAGPPDIRANEGGLRGAGSVKEPEPVMEAAAIKAAAPGGTGKAPVTVMTPLMVPSCGIHPVGVLSSLQRA